MKTLTLLLFSLFSLPLMLNAQTADEMLHKVTAAIEAGQHGQAVSYFRQAISLNIDRSEMFYWTTLENFLYSGNLLPEGVGESETVLGVVIYWEAGENDNRWNLNNGKTLNEGDVLSIDLGI